MKYLTLLLLLCSCASHTGQTEISEKSGVIPEWVYSPYETCKESIELCATGEAKGYTNSDAEAKNNLASIFEVKVKSDLSIKSNTKSSLPWQAKVNQEVEQSIGQSVDQVLETVQIKNRFKQAGLSYSLASLDRVKASELLGERISKLDKELEGLWHNRQRTNLRKLFRKFLERERLNERYSIVEGTGRVSKLTYQDIIAWRLSRPALEPVHLKVGQAPDWLVEKLKELLTEAGFKIVRGETAKNLSLKVESIKEYMNVDGFEKYTFTLHLQSSLGEEKYKVISVSQTVPGRTQTDALLKVKEYFNDYLEEHLSDLHLD
ncbi:MAG TPA: LPP20 family lipoprotein [Bacteriovoracaceae bacterium]|nr:LPP20 family lipoprotein [Bacteriovoracaceae bacterium]